MKSFGISSTLLLDSRITHTIIITPWACRRDTPIFADLPRRGPVGADFLFSIVPTGMKKPACDIHKAGFSFEKNKNFLSTRWWGGDGNPQPGGLPVPIGPGLLMLGARSPL